MQMSERGFKEGMAKVEAEIAKLARQYPRAFEAAAFTVMSDIITASLPDVPVRTGALKASRFVARTVPITGGFGAEYAAAVHELDGGRGWKFLQRALTELLPSMGARLGALTEQYAKSGTTIANVRAVHPERPGIARARAGAARGRAR